MKNYKIVLVTGTDTAIGKTLTSVLLVKALKVEGLNVRVMKPVETGCKLNSEGELEPEDAMKLLSAAEGPQLLSDVIVYRFEMPVAPVVAAAAKKEAESRRISTAIVKERIREQAAKCDVLVVEGAGGLLVPIAPNYTYADLAAECEMDLLVVVGSRLGAINHAALTFEVIKKRNLAAIGYVFNDMCRLGSLHGQSHVATGAFSGENAALSTNRKLLEKVASAYDLVELCYIPHLTERQLASPSALDITEAHALALAVRNFR